MSGGREAEAEAIIARLGMIAHPEGGWYAETWRGGDELAGRAAASAIYFLLEKGQRSHWHRIDGAEVWLWHAGHPLALGVAAGEAGPVRWLRLGGDVLAGEAGQGVIPPGYWQAAEAREGWALVSCVVAPAFRFEGFELAEPGWAPGDGT